MILWVDASISKKENLKFSDLAYAMHRAVAEKHYEITQFKKIIDIFPSILNTMVFNDSLVSSKLTISYFIVTIAVTYLSCNKCSGFDSIRYM